MTSSWTNGTAVESCKLAQAYQETWLMTKGAHLLYSKWREEDYSYNGDRRVGFPSTLEKKPNFIHENDELSRQSWRVKLQISEDNLEEYLHEFEMYKSPLEK